ncbi:Site-specific recombinase XerD [Amycolatopsis tolypomycina]|uniref:Site-specific recombinase XerD n=1 Tax=Amycolatopsis tolypomycina TaxID=208445 RepID=A0A1H5C985_9PSEU|nr:hypothetical protein [Amycolatopsis tolypomycina]SED63087.1 Site-specific recombinase XerD [Amycolatopsis tolypomycina]
MTGRETERYLVDPLGVISGIVGNFEPSLEPATIAMVTEQVAQSRAGRRQLAKAIEDDPSLLTSGRTAGTPLIDRFIRALRASGAVVVVQPVCASCGKPAQRMAQHDEDGLRICVTCYNRAKGTFAPRPCAMCHRVVRPSSYDRQGRPRCNLCPPDPGVDHVEMICELVNAVDPVADRTQLRELIIRTVRQAAQRRRVAWDVEDRPELLTGAAASGTLVVRRLVAALVDHGVEGVVAPQCPFCGKTKQVISWREGLPCCLSCYQKARAKPCGRCGKVRTISTRTPQGRPMCAECARQEPCNQERCSVCGLLAAIVSHRDGVPICVGCWQMPSAVCSICGETKPCQGVGTAAPRCVNCYRRSRTAVCARCAAVHPIGGRDAEGRPLCAPCARRREPCCRCGRVRPVDGRVDDGPVCWTCIKAEPAYFRACRGCGTVTRLHRHGLCEACAATDLLAAALAGRDGSVRAELNSVRHALATSRPSTLLNWLYRPTTSAMLGQLAAGDGPVTHETLDKLTPAGPARYLREVLIAQKVLPDNDRHLRALQRWFDLRLATVDDPEDQRLLRGYLTWTHLRRLRRLGNPATPGSTNSIKNEITSAIGLIEWLHARGRKLRACTQADLDAWCMLGGRTPRRARSFVAWCVARGVTGSAAIAAPAAAARPRVFADEDRRWRTARQLLHDDTIATIDRVAGLLVLLYGQAVSRIVRLTINDVLRADGAVQLRLGRQPLMVPEPLDTLLLGLVGTRRGKAALGHTDDHRWLFPGGLPGQALHPLTLARRLRDVGIPSRGSRNTAMIELAATLPAKILSELLGISTDSATRWAALAGTDGNGYAAELVRCATDS